MTSTPHEGPDEAERERVAEVLAAWDPWQRATLDGLRGLEEAVRDGRRSDALRAVESLTRAVVADAPGAGADGPPKHRRAALAALMAGVTSAYDAGDAVGARAAAEALVALLRALG